jgi:predicted secreted protein
MDLVEDTLDLVLCVGATEEFRLPGFGTSGYQWFYENDSPQVVKVTRSPGGPEPADRLRVGDSVDELFTVEALAAGTATVTFELARPWERAAVTRRRTVTIRVEPSQ